MEEQWTLIFGIFVGLSALWILIELFLSRGGRKGL